MTTKNTALVLGATGGIGGEVARQLLAGGWEVRALKRGATDTVTEDGIVWLTGDAMNAEDVMAAAKRCNVIVHAVNPPGYKHWADLVLPMLDNTIAAATEQGATIVLPGTIYNFGPNAFPVLHEDSPQQPKTRKGAIRVEMEKRLHAASTRGCRVIIVRAGDFFGPKVGNSWFSQGMIKPGEPVSSVSTPNDIGVGHQWSYLPDVASTMVQLLERRESLAPFARFHMAGHWDPDGTKMSQSIVKAVLSNGDSKPKVKAFPWWFIVLASPFKATFRELLEMRYMWKQPIRMSNKKLLAVLEREPHTPLDEAVHATLEGLGCIKKQPDQTA